MILKPFEPYDIFYGLNALKKRLNPSHGKFPQIVEELKWQEAGEFGEQHVLSLLTSNQLPKNTLILHNVSFVSKVKIQIDILVITPFWCLILEVKNIKGIVYFKENPKQLIRIKDDGTEEPLGSPETQVEEFMFGLSSFFERNKIQVPIYGAIVFAFNNAIIKNPPVNIPVMFSRELLRFIWSLERGNDFINPKTVGNLLFKNLNYWDRFPLCEYYEIDPDAIISGVECPNCGTIPMRRTLRTWSCRKCGVTKMDAHVQALNDYQMLINNRITNKECINFLKLRNRQEATRILNKVSTNRTGHKRNSVFELNMKNGIKKQK